MIRTSLRRVRRTDVALAAGFVAFALVEEYVVRMPGGWWPYALTVFALLVLLRRVVPVIAMAVNSVAANATLYNETEVTYRLWQLVAMIIAAFTLGHLVSFTGRRDRLRAAAGGLFVLVTALVYWDADRTDPLAAFFFTGAPYALGIAVAAQTRRLAETATVRASIRERQAREAVMEERVRIARELHDMVAHSVTVMVIQAGVVRRRLDAGLPVDPALLESIESSGRDAVGELRRTLGLLRGDGAETAQPPAGLERLDDLIAQVREAGLTVDVRRTGSAVPLLPAVDLSAYRIAQEALTNVLKHAGHARVVVSLDYREDGLHLGVVNDGARVSGGGSGGGQGLIGMRERVALFGGELVAAPREEGGFSVRARLPLPARAVGGGSLSAGPIGSVTPSPVSPPPAADASVASADAAPASSRLASPGPSPQPAPGPGSPSSLQPAPGSCGPASPPAAAPSPSSRATAPASDAAEGAR